jgi:hypothetical protein
MANASPDCYSYHNSCNEASGHMDNEGQEQRVDPEEDKTMGNSWYQGGQCRGEYTCIFDRRLDR